VITTDRTSFHSPTHSFLCYFIFLTLHLFTDNYGLHQTSWHQWKAMQTDGRIDSPTEIRVTNGCWGAINETLLIQPSAQFCNPWILLLTFQANMLRNSYQLYHHTVSIGRPFFSFTERQATSVHVGYLIFITSPLFPADFQTSQSQYEMQIRYRLTI
jgi:hypothetical protein